MLSSMVREKVFEISSISLVKKVEPSYEEAYTIFKRP